MFNETVSNVKIRQHRNKRRLILPVALTRPALVLLVSAMLLAFVLIQGCGGASAVAASQPSPSISIAPSSASVQMWQNLQFTVSEDTSGAQCTWQTSQPSILTSLGSGQFQGVQQGTTQVSVTCGALSATASVVVTASRLQDRSRSQARGFTPETGPVPIRIHQQLLSTQINRSSYKIP